MSLRISVDDVLRALAKRADRELTNLAEIVEARQAEHFNDFNIMAREMVVLLLELNRDFDLPEGWPEIVKGIEGEYRYIRELAQAKGLG